MSGYYDNEYSDLFEDEGSRQQSGSGLRKQLEEALGKINDLTERLNERDREKDLTALFAEKGKDPAAAALVPKGVDPKEWLEKNAAFIADAKKEQELEHQEQQSSAPEVSVDPALEEERAAMETLSGLVGPGTGIPSTASADPIEKMKAFQSEEELLNFIRSNGAG